MSLTSLHCLGERLKLKSKENLSQRVDVNTSKVLNRKLDSVCVIERKINDIYNLEYIM